MPLDFALPPIFLTFILPIMIGGMIAGFVTGLLGIGGGWLFVPLFLYVIALNGYESAFHAHIAVGTSLAAVAIASSLGIFGHARRGAFNVELLKKWGTFIVIGGVSGGMIAPYLSGDLLRLMFALLLFVNGIRMLLQVKSLLKNPPDTLAFHGSIAFAIGLFASLVGVGGGALATPILHSLKVPLRHAIGTASAFNVCLAIPAALVFAWRGLGTAELPPFSFGYINLAALAMVIPMLLILVPLGVRTAHYVNTVKLKRLFGVFLLLTSLYVGLSLLQDTIG